MPEKGGSGIARLDARTRHGWREWLKKHHTRTGGVWLVLYKKNAGAGKLSYVEAVEEALCFGWIDSKPKLLDGKRFMLWFAPRKPKSIWSLRNKQRIRRLIAEGLMEKPGLEKIDAAKRNGAWRQFDAIDKLVVPDDLQRSLDANNKAAGNFEAFSNSSKKIILYWIMSAKRPGTRTARIKKVVALAAKNVRANHYRP
jgi:uncharacterized protein YdeI (YjbR/CyaY-like superfamily)